MKKKTQKILVMKFCLLYCKFFVYIKKLFRLLLKKIKRKKYILFINISIRYKITNDFDR
jgi:hypothetical protein